MPVNDELNDFEKVENANLRTSPYSLGHPKGKKGLFKKFRWLFYKTCRVISFPFAVSVITSLGGFFIAAQIAFFILATVDFKTTGTGDEFNRLFMFMVMFVYAPGYYIHFGLLYPFRSLRWLSPLGSDLKLLSRYTTGYNIRVGVPEHIQLLVLKAAERLPLANTVAAFIYPSMVLAAVSVQEYLIGSRKNAVTLFLSIFSALVVYSFFTYVIAELISGGVRSRIKGSLKNRGIPYSESSSFSIKLKYLFVGVFVFISFMQLWYMMAFSHNKDIIMPLLFIITTVLIIFGTFFLYYASIQYALDEIEQAAYDLSSGGKGKLFSRSLDKEIINLSTGIVAMAHEVNDNRQNLERKVEERTREVEEALEQLQVLKTQQDGDYYLTSLLCKPLFINTNSSEIVKTEFVIKQKKEFHFRNRSGDLGGDICATGSMLLGDEQQHSRYTIAMNGDAMGKSMQGAGGSLVMGVVMNSIIDRFSEGVHGLTPQKWLKDAYNEIHDVFKSFNGTMVISCVIALVDEESGMMYYFNAEHPFIVVYRNGKADFIEDDLKLRKLGLDSEIPFEVFNYQLEAGDVVFFGSDGRDDINITPEEPYRTINEDDTLFLKYIEECRGNLEEIVMKIESSGELTDDLSILRLAYQEQEIALDSLDSSMDDSDKTTVEEEVIQLYRESKDLIARGDTERAVQVLSEAYALNQNNSKINKILGLLAFKGKDYETASRVLKRQLELDPDLYDFWYYLSIAEKKMGLTDESLQTAKELNNKRPNYVKNLVNLADLYRIQGDFAKAAEYSDKALELDPENEKARRLLDIVGK